MPTIQNRGQELFARITLSDNDGELLIWGQPLEPNTPVARQARTITESTFAHSCSPGRLQLATRSPKKRVVNCINCGLVILVDPEAVTLRELADSLSTTLLGPT